MAVKGNKRKPYKYATSVVNIQSPEYHIWDGMKSRCYNPKRHDYGRYGGRGIKVCQKWRDSFLAFIGDVGQRPDSSYSIDRIDNNGNYEPGNVRWATIFQQRANRRGI
jgi:hypothetical protein